MTRKNNLSEHVEIGHEGKSGNEQNVNRCEHCGDKFEFFPVIHCCKLTLPEDLFLQCREYGKLSKMKCFLKGHIKNACSQFPQTFSLCENKPNDGLHLNCHLRGFHRKHRRLKFKIAHPQSVRFPDQNA